MFSQAPEDRRRSPWINLDHLCAYGYGNLVPCEAPTLRGAIALARSRNVAPAVIGLTVVGFGTSLPELVVCIVAAVAGKPEFEGSRVVRGLGHGVTVFQEGLELLQ